MTKEGLHLLRRGHPHQVQGFGEDDFGGFNLTESKPMDGAPQYPRPVVRDGEDVPF